MIEANQTRYLVVTIDTEVDHDVRWRIADPPRFSSVTEGIPQVFSPLFEAHRVVPTYLLSPEVIEDPVCVKTLRRLGGRAELGTHLHVDFIEPNRSLFRHNMAGQQPTATQAQSTIEVETEKLQNLTTAFADAFGFRPTAFRCGRYGMSPATLGLLVQLGYKVDSSVTPGLCWEYEEGRVDYRHWSHEPAWIQTPAGTILELPLSIRPASRLSPMLRGWSALPRWITMTRLFERVAGYQWLRPSWNTGEDLIRYAKESTDRILVLMLHSTEVMVAASPYAQSSQDVERIVRAMDALFGNWRASGYRFCSMTEAADHVQRNGG